MIFKQLVALSFFEEQPRRGEILIAKIPNTKIKLQRSDILFSAFYAAPLELNMNVDSFSINIPLLPELFWAFSKKLN